MEISKRVNDDAPVLPGALYCVKKRNNQLANPGDPSRAMTDLWRIASRNLAATRSAQAALGKARQIVSRLVFPELLVGARQIAKAQQTTDRWISDPKNGFSRLAGSGLLDSRRFGISTFQEMIGDRRQCIEIRTQWAGLMVTDPPGVKYRILAHRFDGLFEALRILVFRTGW